MHHGHPAGVEEHALQPELAKAAVELEVAILVVTQDRMPHAGKTKDGVTYLVGCCGTGVALMSHMGGKVGEWLAGGDAPALSRLGFPLVPAPYEGRPWFMPVVGEWYRLKDRLAARTRDQP